MPSWFGPKNKREALEKISKLKNTLPFNATQKK